jgi:Zn-dependent protease
MDFEREGRITSTDTAGLAIVLAKIGPKLFGILLKLSKVLVKVVKGLLGFKTAGAAASVGLYSLLFSWQMGVSLVIFIFIHEYGHYRAMKKCGVKTKVIYLIPGFGGAAVAAEGFKSARNEAYISIMGPVYGLFFIIPMIGLYFWTGDPMFAAIASVMSLINLFNLFPINPLDGGRITKSLLYSFRDSIGFFLMMLNFMLAIVFSLSTGLLLITFIALIGFWEVVKDYGLTDKFEKTTKTLIRVLLLLVANGIISNLSPDPGWLEAFGVVVFFLIFFALLLMDLGDTVFDEGKKLWDYPVVVVREAFKALGEALSVKPEDLKRSETERMTRSQTLAYGLVYLVSFVIMLALIIYTSSIPGSEIAKEMLM